MVNVEGKTRGGDAKGKLLVERRTTGSARLPVPVVGEGMCTQVLERLRRLWMRSSSVADAYLDGSTQIYTRPGPGKAQSFISPLNVARSNGLTNPDHKLCWVLILTTTHLPPLTITSTPSSNSVTRVMLISEQRFIQASNGVLIAASFFCPRSAIVQK